MIARYLYRDIVLVALCVGIINQCLKVMLYSIVNKRFVFYKFVQADGFPNLHSAVFSALATTIGIKYGFSSILFSFVAVFSAIVIHDTMRLKGEKRKQVDLLNRIIASEASYADMADEGIQRVFRFTPIDVLSGAAIGIAGSFALL